MRLSFALTTFLSLSGALPIEKASPNSSLDAAAPEAAHPAIATYNYVSTQFATVIAEINQFDWRNPKTDTLYRHAMETLETLRKGNSELRDGPELDMWGTLAFGSTLTNLNFQTHAMTSALRSKKADIDRAQVGLVFYTLLKQCYDDSFEMRKWFIKKEPGWITSLTSGIINEVVNNIASARDFFKPKEGDVTVVVVTEPVPNQPPPPYQPQGQYPPQGQYQPQQQQPYDYPPRPYQQGNQNAGWQEPNRSTSCNQPRP